MTALEFLNRTYKKENEHLVRPRALCEDGFSVSIQGGTEYHYCIPREHVDQYDAVELGYPSEEEETLMEYAEQEEYPTSTVYGYVPIDVVESVIEKHGGIVGAQV